MHQSARIRRDKVWEPVVITGIHEAPRSLIVTTPQGGVYRRNRRHLLPTSESPPNILGPDYRKMKKLSCVKNLDQKMLLDNNQFL